MFKPPPTMIVGKKITTECVCDNGKIYIESISYYRPFGNKLHRPEGDGPALQKYNRDGQLTKEAYYQDGICNRDYRLGPATILWSETGHLLSKSFITNDLLHRPRSEGPAYECFLDGTKDYYENGVRIPEEEIQSIKEEVIIDGITYVRKKD